MILTQLWQKLAVIPDFWTECLTMGKSTAEMSWFQPIAIARLSFRYAL